MFNIRQKLLIGFGGLLLIIILIGTKSILQVTDLGGAIDAILRENYRSVIACQDMRTALEVIDEGSRLIQLGYRDEGIKSIDKYIPVFEKALKVELNNITEPGEGELASKIKTLFMDYKSKVYIMKEKGLAPEKLRDMYYNDLFPVFKQINDTSDKILTVNQANMYTESESAKEKASSTRSQMYVFLLIGCILALVYVFLIGRWILRPIRTLTRSVNEIKNGNLNFAVKNYTHDELGQLTIAFNEMAEGLREFRKANEEKLSRLENSSQGKSSFLSDKDFTSALSHQIKAPLISARMTLSIIQEKKVGELNNKQSELLDIIVKNIEHISLMIDNIIDLNHITPENIKKNLNAVSPYQLVSEAAALYKNEAREKSIELNTVLPQGLPDIIADKSLIMHVFANLLSNAIKFTGAGGNILIHADTVGEYVWFMVADTGKGIPSDYIPKVFDSFFRVPGQEDQTGLGLGLSITKEIIEAHGGTIYTESHEGEWSKFVFMLHFADKASKKAETQV